MTPTNTPLPDLSGLKKADIDLLLDLGARLALMEAHASQAVLPPPPEHQGGE